MATQSHCGGMNLDLEGQGFSKREHAQIVKTRKLLAVRREAANLALCKEIDRIAHVWGFKVWVT
jgi:hypothetical protein